MEIYNTSFKLNLSFQNSFEAIKYGLMRINASIIKNEPEFGIIDALIYKVPFAAPMRMKIRIEKIQLATGCDILVEIENMEEPEPTVIGLADAIRLNVINSKGVKNFSNMQPKKCTYCGEINQGKVNFCSNCGKEFSNGLEKSEFIDKFLETNLLWEKDFESMFEIANYSYDKDIYYLMETHNDAIYLVNAYYDKAVEYLFDASLITERESEEIILESKKKCRIIFALSLFTGYETALFTIPKKICDNFLAMYRSYFYQPLEPLLLKAEEKGAIQEGGKERFCSIAYHSIFRNCDFTSQLGDSSIFEINKKQIKGKITFDSVLIQMANCYYKEIL